jgi:hypothetical protein
MYPQDGWYDHTKPWNSNEERLTGEALGALFTMSSEEIRNLRPPIPRMGLFPPRFGLSRPAIGIRDVIDIDHYYPGARVDYSGMQSGYQGSSFPSLAQF